MTTTQYTLACITQVEMGVRSLNKFIKQKCISKIYPIQHFAGTTIVVDVNVYMYKYEAIGALTQKMEAMIMEFKRHYITPIFIFDGKPTRLKSDIIHHRKQLKTHAKSQLLALDQAPITPEMEHTVMLLKNQAATISAHKKEAIKNMIAAHNMTYCVAPEEADEICAGMVIHKYAVGCMSEDTDMFVYGCPVILRDYDVDTHTVRMYRMADVLSRLGLTMHEFAQLCILAGTDYNKTTSNIPLVVDLFKYYMMYKQFDRLTLMDSNIKLNGKFYDWLPAYIRDRINCDKFDDICVIYKLPDIVKKLEQCRLDYNHIKQHDL